MDLPEPAQAQGKAYGKQLLKLLWSLLIGGGTTVFGADISGIWLGAKRWVDAPFRVDMNGNLTATSVNISGGSVSGITISDYLALAGGTMLGFITLNAAPTADLHAATKKYVDDTASAILPSIIVNEGDVITNEDTVVYN